MSISPTSLLRTWVEIDRLALLHNVEVIRSCVGQASLMIVIKANAYGHGVEGILPTLAPHVDQFAVTCLKEALAIRKLLAEASICLLSAALPDEYLLIAQHRFIPTISSYREAELFAKVAPAEALIHLKIDTGMSRLGIPFAKALEEVRAIKQLPLHIDMISSHLAAADESELITREQLKRFEKLVPALRKIAPGAELHLLNSAGVINYREGAYDKVRVGLMLYGVDPREKGASQEQIDLRPVMTWKARITLIKEIEKGAGISYGHRFIAPKKMRVAILPVGYADGYPRQLSCQGAAVLIQGQRAPLLGNVTMDQIIVDISALSEVSIGDEVVLLGAQGHLAINATDLAQKAGTIPWHIFTGINNTRVDYLYL